MKEGEFLELTDTHFDIYKKYVKHFLQLLGLSGWEYSFKFEDSESSLGYVAHNGNGRCCYFYLNTMWTTPPCNSMLKRVALRACLELLLIGMKRFCYSRSLDEDGLERESANVVRTLENLFLGEKELLDDGMEYDWIDKNCSDKIGFGLKEEGVDDEA